MSGTNESYNILMKQKCQLPLRMPIITQSTHGKQEKNRK